jgi:DNA repair exonuclease SbcCD ATPase subunit
VRISTLRMHGLRRHRDLEVRFAPGLTVVRGPNESGKSTIQRAIELALARRPTSTAADIAALRTWGLPEGDRPVVEMAFEDEEEQPDGTLRVRTGTLVKEFAGAKGTVRLELDGEITTDPALADETLAAITGIAGEAFLGATASIRHREIDIPKDDAALRDRLQSSISGGDRGTSQGKHRLEVAIRGLTSQGQKNPGRLKVAEDAVAGAEASVRAGDEGLARLEADRDALSVARQARAQAEATLAERRALLDKARQAEQLRAQRVIAEERYERYRQAVDVAVEQERLEGSHPSAIPLPSLEQVVARLRALDARARELRAALGEIVDVDFELPSASGPSWRVVAVAGIVLALAGVAAIIGGLASSVIVLAAAGVVMVVAGTLVAVYGERRRGAFDEAVQAREMRESEITRRLRGRSEFEAELRQCETDISAQLALVGLDDLPAVESLLAAEREHVATLGRLAAQLDGLVGREPRETLTPARDAAALEIEQKSAALDALGPIAKEPRARERLEVEVRDVEGALERARDDEAAARARLDANTVDAEQVAAEAERLAAWREELEALRRRERVYSLALAAIVRAETATMKRATRFLESRMRADLPRLTGGRYRAVSIDDATLDIHVRVPETGADVPVARLSQGTFDQVLLAARLGLVRFVLGGGRPPLLLDDPFVTFDPERAAAALGALRDLTTDFQVILFTTSDRYDAAADSVVTLSAPTELAAADDAPAETVVPGGQGSAG